MSDKKNEKNINTSVAEDFQAVTIENKIVETLDVEKKLQEIEVNIKEIKQSLDDLKKETDTFDATKNVLDKTTVDTKKQELENKKNETEKKKKETEELIKNVMALNELKKDIQGYDQNKLKLAWYEKELNALTTWSNFWDKTKQVVSDIRWTAWWKVAVVAAWALSLRWLWKSIFGSDNEESEETDDESSKKKKKKWFLNHGIGKWLKYAGIGILWFLWLRELINYFNGNGKALEWAENSSESVNSTWEDLEKKDPERFKKAVDINNQVNDCRWKQIFQNPDGRVENDMLGETESTSDFIFDKKPWYLIAHMDAHYDSVWGMLNWNDYLMNTLQNAFNKPVFAIMDWGEEAITKSLKWLAGVVTGILPWYRGADGKLTEEWKIELAKPNPEREQQLHNLFGKYMRVKLWYQIKVQQLREKLAKDKLWANTSAGDVEDYLDKQENLTELDAIIQIKFLDVKLIDAWVYLKEQWIPNDTLPENMKEVITDITDAHKKYKTPDLDKVLIDNENPAAHKDWLSKSCTEFIARLSEPAIKRNMAEWVCHAMWFDILANTKAEDIDEIAKQMWFDEIVGNYKKQVVDISLKITNGTATKEDIQQLNSLMESFRMLQLEITMWGIVKNDADGKVDFSTTAGSWAMSFVVDAEGNIQWNSIYFVWSVYVANKVWLLQPIKRTAKTIGKYVVMPWLRMINPMRYWATRSLANRLPTWDYMRSLKYRWAQGEIRFWKDLENGHISWVKAKDAWWVERMKTWRDHAAWQFEKAAENTLTAETIEKIKAWKVATSLDELEKTLTGSKKTLLTKAKNEIAVLEREAERLWRNTNRAAVAWQLDNIKKTQNALEWFARKVVWLTDNQVDDLLKLVDKLSIETVSQLVGKFKNPSKIASFLDDLTKNGDELTETLIHSKLIQLEEEAAANIFKKTSRFTKNFIWYMKNARVTRFVFSHVGDAFEIVAKVLWKVFK